MPRLALHEFRRDSEESSDWSPNIRAQLRRLRPADPQTWHTYRPCDEPEHSDFPKGLAWGLLLGVLAWALIGAGSAALVRWLMR